MTDRSGGCLCGGVRYRVTAPVDHLDACHCGMCRKASGGIALGTNLPADAIVWERDGTLRTYRSSDWAERGFCVTCGSSLFWRMTAPGTAELSLMAGTLDDLSGAMLTTEIYVDHKPDGYAFAGETRTMTEAEVVAAFAATEGDGA